MLDINGELSDALVEKIIRNYLKERLLKAYFSCRGIFLLNSHLEISQAGLKRLEVHLPMPVLTLTSQRFRALKNWRLLVWIVSNLASSLLA
jgi:hypothetical protein